MAELLGLTPRRLQQLAGEGWITKSGRGRYPLTASVKGYLKFLEESARRSTDKDGERRLREIRIEREELALAKEKRAVIPTEEAIAATDDVLGMLKADLDGIPARLTRDLEERAKVKTEIDGVLARAAERLTKAARHLRTGGDDPDAETEDDA
ncbi:hypothetical protein [Afifella aestuarii]|uniref:hypothetical protein n=1 Tax=Afifella aestuarii TaxID=1909496 RepID=UPI001FE3CADA|nr:hypothetical protein [Afifella aestuarii]